MATDAAQLTWNPRAPVLAAGGASGSLALITVRPLAPASGPAASGAVAAPASGPSFASSVVELKSPHTGTITLLRWTPDGARFIVGDSAGVVSLWRFDVAAGRATQAAVVKRAGVITEAAVLTYPGSAPLAVPPVGFTAPGAADSGLPNLPLLAGPGSPATAFVFGADNGCVTYMDEGGRVIDVLPGLHAPVDSLSWVQGGSGGQAGALLPPAGRLVVATRALLFVQLGVYGDGSLVPLTRTKLSLRSGGSLRSTTMLDAAGVLASVCPEEPAVRCWDVRGPVDEPEHYALSATTTGRAIPKAERPGVLAFAPSTGLLATGTDSGHVYVWRYVGGGGITGGSARWEAVATIGTGSGVTGLAWGSSAGSEGGRAGAVGFLTALLATGEVAVLTQAVLRRRVCPPLVAVQLSSQEVAVERVPVTGGPHATFTIRTPLPIRGMSATPQGVLVWTSAEAYVYAVPDAVGKGDASPVLRPASTFATPLSPDIALARDAVLSIDTHRRAVLVHNTAGVVKATLTFPDGDGCPLVLDTSADGRYAGIATDTGRMRLYDLGRSEPVLLGAGVFEAVPRHGESPLSLGTITSLRVNADGSRLALLSTRTPGLLRVPSAASLAGPESKEAPPSVPTPDTRLYTYSLDSDRCCWWEFGPARTPIDVTWDVTEPKLLAVQTEGAAGGAAGGEEAEEGPAPSNREIVVLWTAPEGASLASAAPASSPRSTGSEAGPGAPYGVSDSLVLTDSLVIEGHSDALLGLAAPHIASLLLPSSVLPGASRVALTLLRDFSGLESIGAGGSSLVSGLPTSLPKTGGGEAAPSTPAEAARRALLLFSYSAACGNMDEAYSAVQNLLSRLPGGGASIWANLAASCVRSQRLDVAAVCLGHMGHARGAQALRAEGGVAGDGPAVRAGVLATQLGFLPEAAKAFAAAGRHDLLAQLYVDSGAWDRGAATARAHDRLHEKRLHHARGRQLEAAGARSEAAAAYEAAGAGPREVPRMLMAARDWEGLVAYVERVWREGEAVRAAAGGRGGDEGQESKAEAVLDGPRAASTWPDCTSPSPGSSLPSWYGQQREAVGDGEGADMWYTRARDTPALVRRAMGSGDTSGAMRLVESSGDKAAAYALGRMLEAEGDTRGALRAYGLSGRVSHAIRLAVASGLDAEVLPLAYAASDPRAQLEAARFLEARGGRESLSKAAQLYARAGSLDLAVSVCLAGDLTELLPSLVEEALGGAAAGGPVGSPRKGGAGLAIVRSSGQVALLVRLAAHFTSAGQHARASDMLLRAGKREEALALFVAHNIKVSDEAAEALTPPEEGDGGAAEGAGGGARVALLTSLAALLRKQASYHAAAKKYTQAGDKVRALKCLLAAGDTEKIVFFASVSRSRDIYILAANYLQVRGAALPRSPTPAHTPPSPPQSLPWHTDGGILRTIIDFYSKARSYESLSAFYESCAAVEIDEYRNYEKAGAALKEAGRQAGKIKDDALREARGASLASRIAAVDTFVAARRAAKSDTGEMVALCTQLLGTPDAEAAIRLGDVFALLIYCHAQARDWAAAAAALDGMRARGIAIDPFIERSIVEDAYAGAGRKGDCPPPVGGGTDAPGVEEEIASAQ